MAETQDEQLIKKSLANLPDSPAYLLDVPKIIFLKRGQTKIAHRCSKAKMVIVIDLHDSKFRQFNAPTIDEYTCDCGVVFRKL